jgi:hypothetical protein
MRIARQASEEMWSIKKEEDLTTVRSAQNQGEFTSSALEALIFCKR